MIIVACSRSSRLRYHLINMRMNRYFKKSSKVAKIETFVCKCKLGDWWAVCLSFSSFPSYLLPLLLLLLLLIILLPLFPPSNSLSPILIQRTIGILVGIGIQQLHVESPYLRPPRPHYNFQKDQLFNFLMTCAHLLILLCTIHLLDHTIYTGDPFLMIKYKKRNLDMLKMKTGSTNGIMSECYFEAPCEYAQSRGTLGETKWLLMLPAESRPSSASQSPKAVNFCFPII